MRNAHWRTWNMAKKIENHGKWEIHTLGCEIWRGKLKKVENLEMSTVGHGIWQEKWKSGKWETFTWPFEKSQNYCKTWKMRNAHCRTWKMARKLKISGKWEIHNLGHEIRRGKLKKVENLEMSTVGRGIWQENWKSWKMRNIHLTTWKITKSLKNVKNEKCTL